MGCGALLSCVGGNHPPDQSQGELETRGPRHTPSGCGLVGVVVADESVGGGSGMPGPRWLSGKDSACNAGATGDAGLIPGWGRSPGGGQGNPLQDSWLENPMDRGLNGHEFEQTLEDREGQGSPACCSSCPILCHPLLLLPLIPPSIRVFSNESALHTRAELRPARRQARLPHSRSLLLPGRER